MRFNYMASAHSSPAVTFILKILVSTEIRKIIPTGVGTMLVKFGILAVFAGKIILSTFGNCADNSAHAIDNERQCAV